MLRMTLRGFRQLRHTGENGHWNTWNLWNFMEPEIQYVTTERMDSPLCIRSKASLICSSGIT
jgi:hypothetical protein